MGALSLIAGFPPLLLLPQSNPISPPSGRLRMSLRDRSTHITHILYKHLNFSKPLVCDVDISLKKVAGESADVSVCGPQSWPVGLAECRTIGQEVWFQSSPAPN